jgi:hypothetical protein
LRDALKARNKNEQTQALLSTNQPLLVQFLAFSRHQRSFRSALRPPLRLNGLYRTSVKIWHLAMTTPTAFSVLLNLESCPFPQHHEQQHHAATNGNGRGGRGPGGRYSMSEIRVSCFGKKILFSRFFSVALL